jgi:acetyltransferase-like isoleucine patch superfamily enzyme
VRVGVAIGNNVVMGVNAVVTQSLPEDVVAAGIRRGC